MSDTLTDEQVLKAVYPNFVVVTRIVGRRRKYEALSAPKIDAITLASGISRECVIALAAADARKRLAPAPQPEGS